MTATNSIPTQTPALKIPSIAAQDCKQKLNTNIENMEAFLNIIIIIIFNIN